jgi:hypothetical protein
MFADRFAKDNWGVLYLDLLTESYRRLKKGDLSIEQVEGRTREWRRDRRDNPGQLKLYPEEAR